MRRATGTNSRAGVAWATLAFVLTAAAGALGQDQASAADQGEAPAAVSVGSVTVAGVQTDLGGHLLAVFSRTLGHAVVGEGSGWPGLAGALRDEADDTRVWPLVIEGGGLLGVGAGEAAAAPAAQAIAFDVSLDCNALRAGLAQPFSRSRAGRVLDALTIDNARRARLTGIYADPDDTATLTLVLFSQSRSVAPGRWRAQPLATVRMAPSRGDIEPPRPVEFDFGEQWGGVVVAAADLGIGADPACEGISTEERLADWGAQKAGALRAIVSGLDGRVWLWPGAHDGALVCGMPLARGTTDRRVADALRAVFARRLVWGRDPSGRATATLALTRENRPARDGDRTLSLRFITIVDRTTLTIATNASDLDAAAETLADVSR